MYRVCRACLCTQTKQHGPRHSQEAPWYAFRKIPKACLQNSLQWLHRLLQVHSRHPDLVGHLDHRLILLLQRNPLPLTLLVASASCPCLCPCLGLGVRLLGIGCLAGGRDDVVGWPFAFSCRSICLARRSITLLEVMLL